MVDGSRSGAVFVAVTSLIDSIMKKLLGCLGVLLLAGCAATTPPNVDGALANMGVMGAARCGQQVRDLQRITPDARNPTDGFRRNQLCIAERACANAAAFEQPQWLDAVMLHFIDPYTQQRHDWAAVIQHCQQRSRLNPLRGLLCQREMARYHIFTDLQRALAQSGCSTPADWQRLAGYITTCVDDAYPPLLADYIQNRVVSYRNQVRRECLAAANARD